MSGPGPGHNNPPETGGIAADRLKSLVDRIERLTEEKKALQEDIKDIFAEAKGAGFDNKILRQILKLRQVERADYEEQQELLALYGHALGMSIFD